MIEKYIKLLKDNGLIVEIKDGEDVNTTNFFLFSDNKRVGSFSMLDINYFILGIRTLPNSKDKTEGYCSYYEIIISIKKIS